MKNRAILLTVVFAGAFLLFVLGCTSTYPSNEMHKDDDESFGALADKQLESSEDIEALDAVETPETVEEPAADPVTGNGLPDVKASVAAIADSSAYDVGVAFIDLGNPANNFSVNGERRQLSASMIKLGIMLYAFDRIDSGALSLDQGYTVASGDIVGGTGVLQGKGAGITVTVRELIQLMISQSDNTATNILIDMLGMGNVNSFLQSLGLDASLDRKMMDTAAQAQGIDNYMSADAAAKILQKVYDGSAGSPQLIELAKQALLDQFDRAGIIEGIPSSVSIGHKTGTLTSARNDGAIVYAEHPYVLCVMVQNTSGAVDDSAAISIMAGISEAVYGFWE